MLTNEPPSLPPLPPLPPASPPIRSIKTESPCSLPTKKRKRVERDGNPNVCIPAPRINNKQPASSESRTKYATVLTNELSRLPPPRPPIQPIKTESPRTPPTKKRKRAERDYANKAVDQKILDELASGPDNDDLQLLTLTQLEQETLRLRARIQAAEQRIRFIVTTKTRMRKRCSHEGCTNIAAKEGKCQRHGAPFPPRLCKVEGCVNQVQKRGLCYTHGGKVVCRVEGCTNKVQQAGVCCRHGAGRFKKCNVEGCKEYVHARGRCINHSKTDIEVQAV